MTAVNSLISKFENIAAQEPPPATERVRVTRHSMPLRQSTLKFASNPVSIAQKRRSANGVPSEEARQEPTPPVEEPDNDTIVVNTAEESRHVQLPTPSDSATDVSSQASNTPEVKRIQKSPRSRSKRVSGVRKVASKDTLVTSIPHVEDNEKQRNISGDTLVASANMSQTSLLKDGIDALDLQWNMSNVFSKQPTSEEVAADGEREEEQTDSSSTIEVAVDDCPSFEEKKQQREVKSVKKAENTKKWEQRRKSAEKNATRRSSRASMLLSKATEMVSGLTSTVLGKRTRDVISKNKDTEQETTTPLGEQEPNSKKVRLNSPSTVPQSHSDSLSSAARAMHSRAPKSKKWLISGLYAGQSRTFNASLTESKNKRKSTSATDTLLVGQASEENHILPMPMFAGTRLLTTGRDFKLPFDVFSPLSISQPKPDEWRKVNKNVFIGDAADQWRTSKLLEHSTCLCTPQTGCDSDCMNRFMYYECDSRNCNLKEDQCGNRAFEGLRQRVKKGGKYNVGVEVIKTKDRGYGVRANRTFDSNQIIVEYTGEIINQEECEHRMHGVYKENECYYLMAFDQNMIIDATRGSIARFVNHSCAPNCRMEKWTVGGKPRMALFAGDSGIMTGEELTYDYNFDPYSQKNVQVCRCGSENCRGVLGPKSKDAPKKPTATEDTEGKKEGKLAGAKRKIAEVLEESSHLLNKRRKTIDPVSKQRSSGGLTAASTSEKKKSRAKSVDGTIKRQPSKLQKKNPPENHSSRSSRFSTTQNIKTKRNQRIVSTSSSQAALITKDEDELEGEEEDDNNQEENEKSSVTTLIAKAENIRRNMARSLRGRR